MTPWRERVSKSCVRRRAILIKALGGKCIKCGATEKLEFDHPNGRDWGDPKNVASHMRLIVYEQEYLEGKLRLLCADCNKRNPPKRNDVPF